MNRIKYKILIIAPAWVGDIVMSQTLFKMLKMQYGDHLQLDVFANNFASGLLSRMSEVNEVIVNPFSHGKLDLFKRVKLGLQLRNKKYDQVFILPNSLKSAIMTFFAGIKKRTGFVGELRYILLNDIYKLDKEKLPLMIDRFCALANFGNKPKEIKFPSLEIDPLNQEHLINKFGLDANKPIIVFCPAAEYGPAKRWPVEYFAKLADLLGKDSYQIIILGSNKDVSISKQIYNLAVNKNMIVDLCGLTNLTDAVDLLAKSKYVITNDSGLMHVACAVNAKVISIYGSSSPGFTPPLSKSAKLLSVKLECSPCFQRTCRFGHYNCLKFILPEDVFAKMNL